MQSAAAHSTTEDRFIIDTVNTQEDPSGFHIIGIADDLRYVRDSFDFIILATDGLSDHLLPQDMVDLAASAFRAKKDPAEAILHAAVARTERSRDLGGGFLLSSPPELRKPYMDDMTVVVAKMRPTGISPKPACFTGGPVGLTGLDNALLAEYQDSNCSFTTFAAGMITGLMTEPIRDMPAVMAQLPDNYFDQCCSGSKGFCSEDHLSYIGALTDRFIRQRVNGHSYTLMLKFIHDIRSHVVSFLNRVNPSKAVNMTDQASINAIIESFTSQTTLQTVKYFVYDEELSRCLTVPELLRVACGNYKKGGLECAPNGLVFFEVAEPVPGKLQNIIVNPSILQDPGLTMV
eukprot:gene4637-9389_t